MRNQITNYIRAGYPGINIISCEEARIEAELKTIAESLGHNLYGWSITQGLVDAKDGHRREALEPLAAIDAIEELHTWTARVRSGSCGNSRTQGASILAAQVAVAWSQRLSHNA